MGEEITGCFEVTENVVFFKLSGWYLDILILLYIG